MIQVSKESEKILRTEVDRIITDEIEIMLNMATSNGYQDGRKDGALRVLSVLGCGRNKRIRLLSEALDMDLDTAGEIIDEWEETWKE